MTSVKVVHTESGSFWGSNGHQMVGTFDHFICASLTSEKQSLDVCQHCHRQVGTSCLAWPLPVVHGVC